MNHLFGEYDCKMDTKGRVRVPKGLLEQFDSEKVVFYINRGFEKCLMMYPEKVWDGIVENINQLNLYKKDERDFVRYFFRGVSRVEVDSADRILLSKALLSYSGIEKDAVLFAYLDRIEIWDKQNYGLVLDEEPEQFSELAERIFGEGSQNKDNAL